MAEMLLEAQEQRDEERASRKKFVAEQAWQK